MVKMTRLAVSIVFITLGLIIGFYINTGSPLRDRGIMLSAGWQSNQNVPAPGDVCAVQATTEYRGFPFTYERPRSASDSVCAEAQTNSLAQLSNYLLFAGGFAAIVLLGRHIRRK